MWPLQSLEEMVADPSKYNHVRKIILDANQAKREEFEKGESHLHGSQSQR